MTNIQGYTSRVYAKGDRRGMSLHLTMKDEKTLDVFWPETDLLKWPTCGTVKVQVPEGTVEIALQDVANITVAYVVGMHPIDSRCKYVDKRVVHYQMRGMQGVSTPWCGRHGSNIRYTRTATEVTCKACLHTLRVHPRLH